MGRGLYQVNEAPPKNGDAPPRAALARYSRAFDPRGR